MPATIRDVAREAGVSVATVSRALNSSGPVGAETRQRIEAAAKALRYTPNSAARSLITRRTGMLGVLLPDLFGEFFSELMRGMDEAAQAHGYHLLLSSSHDHADEVSAALQTMNGRVDGLVVMAPTVAPRTLRELLPGKVPVVLVNSAKTTGSSYALGIDNRGGAYAIVAHLIGHGHERIAMIMGPAGNHDAEERLIGYRAALEEAGIAPAAELAITGDFRSASGYRATESILELKPRPTAIFAANDAMAMGALSALRDARVAVPDEMALVGFDDLSSAAYSIPPLSSVHVPISQLGAHAIACLATAVLNGSAAQGRSETLAAYPVFRGSCGCPDWTAGDESLRVGATMDPPIQTRRR